MRSPSSGMGSRVFRLVGVLNRMDSTCHLTALGQRPGNICSGALTPTSLSILSRTICVTILCQTMTTCASYLANGVGPQHLAADPCGFDSHGINRPPSQFTKPAHVDGVTVTALHRTNLL